MLSSACSALDRTVHDRVGPESHCSPHGIHGRPACRIRTKPIWAPGPPSKPTFDKKGSRELHCILSNNMNITIVIIRSSTLIIILSNNINITIVISRSSSIITTDMCTFGVILAHYQGQPEASL